MNILKRYASKKAFRQVTNGQPITEPYGEILQINLKKKWTTIIQQRRSQYNLIDQEAAIKSKKRNETYRKRLTDFKKLPATIVTITNFNNYARETPLIISVILINHIRRKLLESNIRKAKKSNENIKTTAMLQVYSEDQENGALDAVTINFLIHEIKSSYAEKLKSFSSNRLLKRQVQSQSLNNFIDYIKTLGKPIAPPVEQSKRMMLSNRYKNNKRDYLSTLGEIEAIIQISTLARPLFIAEDRAILKNYKENMNIEIREYNKIVNVVTAMQKDEYVDGHSSELRAFIQSYQKKDVDTRYSEKKQNINNYSQLVDMKKQDIMKGLKKWSTDFINKNAPTELSASAVFFRGQHWMSNLLQKF